MSDMTNGSNIDCSLTGNLNDKNTHKNLSLGKKNRSDDLYHTYATSLTTSGLKAVNFDGSTVEASCFAK
jgi:hypothetical protein